MKSILITGCNRGLGLGIIKQLVKLKNPPEKVIATCRDVKKAQELQQLASENKNIHILEVDIHKELENLEIFAKKVESLVKEDGLNVLFNNAGVSPKSTRINFVKTEQLLDTFKVNTVGPIMLTKALLPLLKQASKTNSNQPLGTSRAAVINMSSVLGSIKLNTDGGLYPYRCSKAALNIATASLSVDLKNDGIVVMSLHPGWVKTDMGGSNAPIDVDESTCKIVKLLTEISEEHNGKFYQWDGKSLPW